MKQSNSIQETHDKAIVRAIECEYSPKQIGIAECTIFIGKLNSLTTESEFEYF